MAKAFKDPVFDAALAKIATGTRVVVCSGEPANFAGIAAVALADIATTPGDGAGDWVISDGDVSGRKVRLGAQSTVTVDSTGTATHVSVDDGTILLAVTTCTSQALTAANTVNIPVVDFEFTDPT